MFINQEIQIFIRIAFVNAALLIKYIDVVTV